MSGYISSLILTLLSPISAGELPRERGVPEEPEAGHQDARLRHRDVRRVLAPHTGQCVVTQQ